MIDNFAQIEELLDFTSEDDYYFLEVIQRKKDFPFETALPSQWCIKTYAITSKDMLEKVKHQVELLCDHYHARAYINLNKKSKKKTTMILMKECLSMLENESCNKLFSKLDSAAGQCTGDKKTRTFLLDIDSKDEKILAWMKDTIKSLSGEVKAVIPTVNGYHVISTPFNVQEFNKHLGLNEETKSIVEIKHNCPTLLYFN